MTKTQQYVNILSFKEDNMRKTIQHRTCFAFVAAIVLLVSPAFALEEGDEDLAQESQNPVGNLINLRFENNLLFDVGPHMIE